MEDLLEGALDAAGEDDAGVYGLARLLEEGEAGGAQGGEAFDDRAEHLLALRGEGEADEGALALFEARALAGEVGDEAGGGSERL